MAIRDTTRADKDRPVMAILTISNIIAATREVTLTTKSRDTMTTSIQRYRARCSRPMAASPSKRPAVVEADLRRASSSPRVESLLCNTSERMTGTTPH